MPEKLDRIGVWLRRSSRDRRYALPFIPGLAVLLFTALTDVPALNPGTVKILFWSPFEIVLWFAVLLAGGAAAYVRENWVLNTKLREISRAEEQRRAIAAIGMAASWDLDLSRLYARVSQDLRSLLEFDRLVITSALPTGRMRIEFVSGPDGEGFSAGAILPEVPDQPDGLHAEYRDAYQSRLTVAIAACNGTLTIRSKVLGKYSPADLDVLRQAVAQISPGIANAILFQSSEQRLRERTVLADIGLAVTSTADPYRIIEAVNASLKKLIDYDHLGVILLSDRNESSGNGELVYWSNSGLSGLNAGDEIPFSSDAAYQGEVISATGSDFSLGSPANENDGSSPRAWLRAPLFVQEKLIGVLVVSSLVDGALGEEEEALLLNVSLQIAPAIQNAKLTGTLKRQADERRTIAAIGLAANSELNLDAIYNGVAEELAKVLDFDRLAITHKVPETGEHEIAYTAGISAEGYNVGDRVRLQMSDEPVKASKGSEFAGPSSSLRQLVKLSGLSSRASAPLGTTPNVLGTLSIGSLEENRYDDTDVELLRQIAIQITPAIKNARMIAAERELRETLDRQNKELYEANNARKQFLSTVSHELKTPLTIISGFIDLLATPDQVTDEDERRETFEIIRRNADSLDVLINDILDISRLDAGTFKLDPAAFPMNDLISDLEASFQSLLRTKTQTLAVNMGKDELWVRADRSRISQVITNLLSNASKYSPESTEITLGCQIDGDRLRVSVADQGVGMTEEEQKGLFTAFFRADNETTRTVPGTGLGLVIAKSITELHGGEIRLESQPGVGTTIDIWLPELTTEEEAEAETAEQETITGSRLWPDGPPDDVAIGAD